MAATHGDEFKRDAARHGDRLRRILEWASRRLGKVIRALSEEGRVPERDADLLRENERLREENRILREGHAANVVEIAEQRLRACNVGFSQAARSRDIGTSG